MIVRSTPCCSWKAEAKVPAAPHLSCVGDSKDDLRGLLTQYKAAGIKRIVALRGDLPSGMGMASGELRYANDLKSLLQKPRSLPYSASPFSVPAVPSDDSNVPAMALPLEQWRSQSQVLFNADTVLLRRAYSLA